MEVGDDPRPIVNISVWESQDALFDYVYKSGHLRVLARRKAWFERLDTPSIALWWTPVGAPPTLEDGLERLDRLVRLVRTAPASGPWYKARFPVPNGAADRITAIA